MRIGIVPVLNPSKGGVYQYSLSMLRALHDWTRQSGGNEFIIFAREVDRSNLVSMNRADWRMEWFPSKQHRLQTLVRRLGNGLHRQASSWGRRKLKLNLPNPERPRFQARLSSWFRQFQLDLVLYPDANVLSFETRHPYVMAIHDLQHRLQPEFPEVSADGEWERREYLFRNAIRYATLLLADSDVGKEHILEFYGCYGVTSDRVKVLPFLPAHYLSASVSDAERKRVRSTHHLPERYLFYPAQFWPHKNHARIVKALRLLRDERRLRIPLVLAGSYSGELRERTFKEVMSLCSEFGLERDVRVLGYVPEQDMSSLYAEAVALVMPTFFGPTNIPVLEAWAFGCPVLTSDVRGIREQVGDAAVLADPRSVEAIAAGIYRLWLDENLRHILAARGHRRLAAYTPDDYRCRLIESLEHAKAQIANVRPRLDATAEG